MIPHNITVIWKGDARDDYLTSLGPQSMCRRLWATRMGNHLEHEMLKFNCNKNSETLDNGYALAT